MKSRFFLVAVAWLLSCLSSPFATSQELLSLGTLQPAFPAPSPFSNPQGVYSPLPSIVNSDSITLESIPQNLQSTPLQKFVSANEVEIIPIKPAAKAGPDLRAGQLKVESMIHQQKEPIELFSKLSIDNTFLASATIAPTQRGQAMDGYSSLDWSSQGYGWHSPAFCHKPLYFEQPNFERYGTRNPYYLAPTLSAAHFFGTVVLLPVQAVHLPPWCKSCTLGNRRPGDCNPIQQRPYEH